MKLIEIKGDLFTKENMQDKNIYLAHCISRDCEMGLGIAKTFDKKFPNMKNALKNRITNMTVYTLYDDKVFNLITKNKYWQKPTYISLENSLKDMATSCKLLNVKILVIVVLSIVVLLIIAAIKFNFLKKFEFKLEKS